MKPHGPAGATPGREENRGTPLRVLMVEDSRDDVLLLVRELRRGGYDLFYRQVDDPESMRAALDEGEWDVVLSDHAMPGFSAPAALAVLNEKGWQDVPFIIVSGYIGEDAAVQVMKAGAHDFIPKGSLARLAPVIERELMDARVRRERRHAQEALRRAEEKYRGIFENSAEGIFQTTTDGCIVTANPMMARILGYESPEQLSGSVRSVARELYVDPGQRQELVERIRRDGVVYRFEARLRRRDGSDIWTSITATAIKDGNGDVIGYEGNLEDITSRKLAEERLRRTLDRLLALHEAGSVLGSTLEPEEIGDRLLEIMRRISGLTAAVINVCRERRTLGIWRSAGLENLPPGTRNAPEVSAALRTALEDGEPKLFELRLESGAYSDSTDGMSAGLCLPLKARERTLGVLEVYGPAELAGDESIQMLASLAAQASSALENARLYRELAEREQRLQDLVGKILIAQEDERRRVSYEVHDGLAQIAAAAHQHLQAFAQFYPPSSPEGREDLERVAALVRQTVAEARRIIADLRPTALDDFGLKVAVRLQLEALMAEGWQIDYRSNLDDERLPVSVETTLFRVAQEALNNVGKHAGTTRVRLRLESRDGDPGSTAKVRLLVRDYGKGFSLEEAQEGRPGERVGLRGMRERVALLGGEFRVFGRPGVGTLILAEVPLNNRDGGGE